MHQAMYIKFCFLILYSNSINKANFMAIQGSNAKKLVSAKRQCIITLRIKSYKIAAPKALDILLHIPSTKQYSGPNNSFIHITQRNPVSWLIKLALFAYSIENCVYIDSSLHKNFCLTVWPFAHYH